MTYIHSYITIKKFIEKKNEVVKESGIMWDNHISIYNFTESNKISHKLIEEQREKKIRQTTKVSEMLVRWYGGKKGVKKCSSDIIHGDSTFFTARFIQNDNVQYHSTVTVTDVTYLQVFSLSNRTIRNRILPIHNCVRWLPFCCRYQFIHLFAINRKWESEREREKKKECSPLVLS